MSALVKRKLKPPEIKRLMGEIKGTPNIVAISETEWQMLPEVWVAEIGGELAGIGGAVDISPHWSEVGPVIVLSDFRGHGLGRALFDQAFADLTSRQRQIYAVSRHPAVINMMRRHQMEIIPWWSLPSEVMRHNMDHFMHSLNLFHLKEFMRKKMIYRPSHGLCHGVKRDEKR